ncbi:DUF3887 domain-containing protein [Olleya aquimaris]|uniref:DUF3887 domain-containing protein n=1 Tax=Olleya sediminilitoris TaxID=2795739 RepID=A0ABS1WN99_9FLAO|nr:DUF3887 domain-containing protein [Olleya sediminilitoris]AXO81096.1 DUF3887 domain-containing protein [Olleya aquimaris]MBL7560607.1 DUF3887 domain-containing protein [Olleya sediminilitoris]
MKKILFILALLVSTIGFAQESQTSKTIASTFQKHYNNGDVDGIYSMFNSDFKKVLTLEKTKAYFKDQLKMNALGKMKSIEYVDTVRSGNNYTMVFENGVYNAYFKAGTDNKLEFLEINSIN